MRMVQPGHTTAGLSSVARAAPRTNPRRTRKEPVPFRGWSTLLSDYRRVIEGPSCNTGDEGSGVLKLALVAANGEAGMFRREARRRRRLRPRATQAATVAKRVRSHLSR